MSAMLRLVNCPHCGCEFEVFRPRSSRHHRLFFAVIAWAFDNWPEAHDFKPDNPEHLRAWLFREVGYIGRIGNGYNILNPDPGKLTDFWAQAFHAARLSGGYGWLEQRENGDLEFITPRSIAWNELDQQAFNPVAERVFNEIAAIFDFKIGGVDWKKKVKDHKRQKLLARAMSI